VAALLYKSIPIFNRDGVSGLLTANGEGRAYLRRSALRGASHVIVSADAAHVYASAHNDNSVVAMRRDTQTGKLALVDSRQAGAGGLAGLQQPNGVALSPDDLHLYAASGYVGEVASFVRDISSGVLSVSQQINNGTISALATANKVIVSPDGAHVYVGTQSASPTVAVFTRNVATGALTWVQNVSGQTGLSGVSGFCFSPDGVYLYVTNSGNSSKTVVFQRDAMSGQLTWVQSTMSRGNDVAISSDGGFVYVASDALQVFQRNPATGMLLLVQQQTFLNGSSGSPMAATTVAISPDDKHVYAASQQNAALTVFSRNLGTGLLTYVELHFDGVNGVDGLEGGLHAAVSSDGKHLYVSSFDDDAIAIFARDAATGALTFVQAKR
jgi:6-phosphogluconolactonase (cycloisomerase 2 family)